jgi:hypothetical protein
MICSPLCPSLQLESWADRGVAILHEPESYPMFAGTAKPLLPTSLARQVHLNLPIHSLGGPLVPPEVVFPPYIPVPVALPCPHCLFRGGGGGMIAGLSQQPLPSTVLAAQRAAMPQQAGHPRAVPSTPYIRSARQELQLYLSSPNLPRGSSRQPLWLPTLLCEPC